jgi:hypothetical protein
LTKLPSVALWSTSLLLYELKKSMSDIGQRGNESTQDWLSERPTFSAIK